MIRRTILRVLPLVVGLLSSAVALHAQATGTIRGRVVSEAGQPVPGARVTLVAGERTLAGVVTDRAGRFLLVGAAAGAEQELRVEGLGFRAASRKVRAGEGEVEVALVPAAIELEGVRVVSITRSSTPVAAVPGAVTVVGSEEIEAEMAVSRSVGEILGKAVPGLAVGTQSMSNHGQSLRGRGVAVLIDGVPQSTLRNVSRDFVNIDPAMIERVEVLRGATSLYGDGATGGVINIVTRSPGAGPPSFSSDLSVSGSLSRVGDGLGGRLFQGVTGRTGSLDYVGSASLSSVGGFFDAEGDLIPADPHGQGGLADTRSYDLLGKVGYTFGAQRVQASANHFRSIQDTEYTADPSVNRFPAGTRKARALPGLREAEPQGTRNTLLSLDYAHQAALAGEVRAQLYYRDYLTRFRGFDRRRYNRKTGALVSGQVSQSFVVSERVGGRLEAESRPLGAAGPSLVWGADYTYENTSQPVGILDPAVYDASGGLVFEKIGERVWVPPLRPHSLGLFAQLGWQLTDDLMVRGGVRRERVRLRVEDFVTLDDNPVFGGELAYDPTLFNVGVVLGDGSPLSAFANFSQGFSMADIGRILRAAPAGFDLGNNALPAPKVDHYEVGARGMWNAVEASAALFRSTSELGTRLVENEVGMLEIARAPERIHGVEATLDVRPAATLGVGGTVSWTEGDWYSDSVERWYPLDGYRIQPLKATAYLTHETLPGWSNRVHVLFSGSRERAAEERVDPTRPLGRGEQPVRRFTVVDFTSAARVGPGTLQVGVENLLNRQYFDIVSQLDQTDGNAYYTAARGASLTLGYSVRY